jgi:hypothetical protein
MLSEAFLSPLKYANMAIYSTKYTYNKLIVAWLERYGVFYLNYQMKTISKHIGLSEWHGSKGDAALFISHLSEQKESLFLVVMFFEPRLW